MEQPPPHTDIVMLSSFVGLPSVGGTREVGMHNHAYQAEIQYDESINHT